MSTLNNLILTPNKPNVASEKFEDEYIVVSLINGNYYSLRGTAADIWLNIENSCSTHAVVAAFKRQFDLNSRDVELMESFFNDLLGQELVKEISALKPEMNSDPIHFGESFEAPILETYSDMQDLLLLDPIHDVDEETGWPQAGPEKNK